MSTDSPIYNPKDVNKKKQEDYEMRLIVVKFKKSEQNTY